MLYLIQWLDSEDHRHPIAETGCEAYDLQAAFGIARRLYWERHQDFPHILGFRISVPGRPYLTLLWLAARHANDPDAP